jgi:hypothetical protein
MLIITGGGDSEVVVGMIESCGGLFKVDDEPDDDDDLRRKTFSFDRLWLLLEYCASVFKNYTIYLIEKVSI